MEVEPGRGSVDAEIRERSFLAQTLGSNPTEGWGGSSARLDLSTGVGAGEGARPAPASADPRGSARVQRVPLHSSGEGVWLQPTFAASSSFYTSSKTRSPGNDPASLKQSRLPPQCFPSCCFRLRSPGSLPAKSYSWFRAQPEGPSSPHPTSSLFHRLIWAGPPEASSQTAVSVRSFGITGFTRGMSVEWSPHSEEQERKTLLLLLLLLLVVLMSSLPSLHSPEGDCHRPPQREASLVEEVQEEQKSFSA